MAVTRAVTVLGIVEARAGETPDLAACICDRVTLGYGELWERSGRHAARLQREGVAAGDRVVLTLPNGPEFFTVFYGIQRAGAVPAPVFPGTGP